jgi:hypothetical protein
MLVDFESVKRLNEQPLDWFIVRCVPLDNTEIPLFIFLQIAFSR